MKAKTLFVLLILLAWCSTAAMADIAYKVQVDTSSIVGTSGVLDFGFNSWVAGALPITATITDFAGDGTVGGETASGNASGSLLNSVLISNQPDLVTFYPNDFAAGFVYGNSLSFIVTFSGPGLSGASDSSFVFSMLDDQDPANPQLLPAGWQDTNAGGFAVTIDIDDTGAGSAAALADFTSADPAQPVPEPAAFFLLSVGVVGLAAMLRRRR